MQVPTAQQLNNELDSTLWPYFDTVIEGDLSLSINTMLFDIRVDDSLSYFAGHFPEQPVLPGVVQVHWAGQLARRYFACTGFTQLKKTKFSNVVLPNTQLQLNLKFKPDTGVLSYSYQNAEQKFSSGQISFAVADNAQN